MSLGVRGLRFEEAVPEGVTRSGKAVAKRRPRVIHFDFFFVLSGRDWRGRFVGFITPFPER